MEPNKSMVERMRNDSREEFSLPDDATTKRIAELAEEQLKTEKAIETLEKSLDDVRKHLTDVREKLLPDLLLEHGIADIRLKNGARVTVEKIVCASIKNSHRDKAFRWLESKGFGALVKASLVVKAEKGEEGGGKIDKLVETADELGLEAKKTEEVHPQTLKAFVSEQIEKGAELPQDLFGVFIVNRTKIKTT